MTDLVMRKRAGRAGEFGLFVDSEVWEEDFGNIKMDAEVQVKATTPRSLRQLKFAWSLATKVAEGCDWVESKEDAMDFLLIEAKHFRRIFDPLRNVAILKPKPTNFGAMDGTEYTRLLKRIVWVAVNIMIPGMDDKALIAEIEAMVGPDVAPSEPVAAKGTRAPRATKAAPEPALAAPDANPEPDPVPPSDGKEDQATESGEAGTRPRSGDAKEGPTDEASYIAAARSWIKKQTASHADARAYFEGDHHVALRQRCGVSIGVRNLLRRELAARYEEGK